MNDIIMTSTLLQLADLGVTGVYITFEGGGDSGAIESILYTKNEFISFDFDNDNFEFALGNLSKELCDQIENFADHHIIQEYEDWWNNDGGFGNLKIMVPSGKFVLETSVRVTEYEDSVHNGNLIETAAIVNK
jgi:hypothetical protein